MARRFPSELYQVIPSDGITLPPDGDEKDQPGEEVEKCFFFRLVFKVYFEAEEACQNCGIP